MLICFFYNCFTLEILYFFFVLYDVFYLRLFKNFNLNFQVCLSFLIF